MPLTPRTLDETTSRATDPVFVDRTGRRRRLAVFAGVGIGLGLLTSLALILAGLFTGSAVPVPSWPEGGSGHRSDDGVVADHLGPSASPDPPTPTVAKPPTATPSSATTRTTAPSGQPSTTGRPSQSSDQRGGPGARPSKSPNRPK